MTGGLPGPRGHTRLITAALVQNFDRDFDGHPLLAWMGGDWAGFVVMRLLEQLRRQSPGTELVRVRCAAPPEIETRVAGDGAVRAVELAVALELVVRAGSGVRRRLDGSGRFSSEGMVAFDITSDVLAPSTRERLAALLAEARERVLRDDNRFLYSSWADGADAAAELDRHAEDLRTGRPVDLAGLGGVFLPTGPMQELALDSGWGDAFLDLADRFDEICAEDREPEALEPVLDDRWRCGVCDEDAGAITLLVAAGRAEARRESFTGVMTARVERDRYDTLRTALGDADLEALRAFDLELVPFYCPDCRACYCGAHWRWWDEFDEELPGLRDCVRGVCPDGHERMLED